MGSQKINLFCGMGELWIFPFPMFFVKVVFKSFFFYIRTHVCNLKNANSIYLSKIAILLLLKH